MGHIAYHEGTFVSATVFVKRRTSEEFSEWKVNRETNGALKAASVLKSVQGSVMFIVLYRKTHATKCSHVFGNSFSTIQLLNK